MSRAMKPVMIQALRNGQMAAREDVLAVEEPLEIRVRYWADGEEQEQALSVTMRTPGADEALAAGFLFTEGIIPGMEAVARIDRPAEDCDRRADNIIIVSLKPGVAVDMARLQRHFYTTSSCGVCGKASIEAIHTFAGGTEMGEFTLPASLLCQLPQRLREAQEVFESTGGLHASAIFDLDMNLLLLQEDVGRHNALDKLIGKALKENIPLKSSILLLSGRASFELIQKAAMAGICFVAAIGAPSSLAVELATSSGITLLGFLNQNRFNIYSGAHRVDSSGVAAY